MEWAEVKKWLEANKDSEEVKGYLKGAITPEGVQAFLETEEGKKLLQPKLDQYFTKGLETWKQKSLPQLLKEKVEEEIKKRYPEETEEQKRLRQLEQTLEQEKNARIRAELRSKAINFATQEGLPAGLVDHFVGQDEDSTNANLAKLKEVWKADLEKAVNEKFKESGRKTPPGGGGNDYTGKNPWRKETFNLTQQAKILKENPELAKQLQAQAKI